MYVFSLEGINYDDQMIEGFFYSTSTSQWEKANLPFPQSIFRRINLSRDTIKKLQTATCGRMFNNNFFDKWKFWNIACKYPQLVEHLPYTQLLKSISDIDDMFESFDTLFLKPADGTHQGDVNKFMAMVRKYTDIQELSPAITNEFIDRIIVHEPEKARGSRIQKVEIIYNGVGMIDLSQFAANDTADSETNTSTNTTSIAAASDTASDKTTAKDTTDNSTTQPISTNGNTTRTKTSTTSKKSA